MRRHIKPIIAFAVALMLAGCNDTLNGDTWNERENLLISGGLKALANSAKSGARLCPDFTSRD